MLIKKNLFSLSIIAISTILIGSCSILFLPEKYFFDANLIANDPYNEKGLIGSYAFCMWFYDTFKLNRLPYPLVSFIQLSIIFYIIKKIGVPKNFYKFNLRNIVVWLTLLMFSVYLSMPSKEFINFLYVALICFILISPKFNLSKKILLISLLFIFFSVWFRPYYVLLPFLMIGLFYLSRINFKKKVIGNIFWGLIIACFFSFSYGVIKGEFMSETSREKLNKKRIGRQDSQTVIISPVETNTVVGEGIGIFYGFFSVNFPINGLRFFYKPQVLAFIFWQLLMSVLLIKYYSRCINNRVEYRNEEWVFHIVFSYFIVQGVFEPDLGSAVKHKLGFFPLIYLAFYYNQDLIKKGEKSFKYVFKRDK